MLSKIYQIFIAPHADDTDDRRREFILNSLLLGIFGLALFALCITTTDFILGIVTRLDTLVTVFIFVFAIALLIITSRRGHPKLAAVLFQLFLLASSLLFVLDWGYRLPEAQLMFALMIVIAGVLFHSRFALIAAGVAVLGLFVVANLQIAGIQVPYTDWQTKPFNYTDLYGCMVVFMALGIVSWLSNHETDKSLKRARKSERALAKERDNLELKVLERTRELEELQVARLLEMQPFAEFGRIGAGLVHEIANPLTAASLNLEELSKQQHSELVKQVKRNLNQLEKYLSAARKQLKRESELRSFSVGTEIKEIMHLMRHRARRANVRLATRIVSQASLYGDVVKFDQLLANLIANAIDASESVDGSVVSVTLRTSEGIVIIEVNDRGQGIPKQIIKHLFEPFYSTKTTARSGLGIGLALAKQYVEEDFHGSISVESSVANGTTFAIMLKGQNLA